MLSTHRVVRTITLVGAVAFASASPALGHVAPGITDNNRYLKLTPAADRIRLAYTVFYGEEPGAILRRSLDTDTSGQLSDAEGQVFAEKVAAEIASSLEITIDGTTHPVTWTSAAVGMGTPAVKAGAFSIDFVAWLCLPAPRGTHTVLVRDRFRIPNPGETEIKVEDALGITIDRTAVGPASAAQHDYKFLGPGGPLSEDGLALTFTASDAAPLGDSACGPPPGGGLPKPLVIGAGALIGVGLAYLVARRTQRPRAKKPRT